MKFLSKKPNIRIFLLGGIIGVFVFAILMFATLYSTDWGERSSWIESVLEPFSFLFWLPLKMSGWFDQWLQNASMYGISNPRGPWWFVPVFLFTITFIYSGLIFVIIRQIVRFFRKKRG